MAVRTAIVCLTVCVFAVMLRDGMSSLFGTVLCANKDSEGFHKVTQTTALLLLI